MTVDFENYFENDIGLSEDDLKSVRRGPEITWYKPSEKGRVDRAAIIYFHPVDVVAVKEAMKERGRLSKEEMASIAQQAREARAKELGKSVEQLTKVDLLDTSRIQFKRYRAHYVEGKGGELSGYILSRLGKDGPEADEVWRKLPEPKDYVVTLLLLYPTKNGVVDKEQLKMRNWRIQPWRMGPKVYKDIFDINAGLIEDGDSIADRDLKLECEEPKFQKIKPSMAGKSLWRRMAAEVDPRITQEILTQAMEYYEKLCPFRELSTEELRVKLGLASPSGGGDEMSDFADMLDV